MLLVDSADGRSQPSTVTIHLASFHSTADFYREMTLHTGGPLTKLSDSVWKCAQKTKESTQFTDRGEKSKNNDQKISIQYSFKEQIQKMWYISMFT